MLLIQLFALTALGAPTRFIEVSEEDVAANAAAKITVSRIVEYRTCLGQDVFVTLAPVCLGSEQIRVDVGRERALDASPRAMECGRRQAAELESWALRDSKTRDPFLQFRDIEVLDNSSGRVSEDGLERFISGRRDPGPDPWFRTGETRRDRVALLAKQHKELGAWVGKDRCAPEDAARDCIRAWNSSYSELARLKWELDIAVAEAMLSDRALVQLRNPGRIVYQRNAYRASATTLRPVLHADGRCEIVSEEGLDRYFAQLLGTQVPKSMDPRKLPSYWSLEVHGIRNESPEAFEQRTRFAADTAD